VLSRLSLSAGCTPCTAIFTARPVRLAPRREYGYTAAGGYRVAPVRCTHRDRSRWRGAAPGVHMPRTGPRGPSASPLAPARTAVSSRAHAREHRHPTSRLYTRGEFVRCGRGDSRREGDVPLLAILIFAYSTMPPRPLLPVRRARSHPDGGGGSRRCSVYLCGLRRELRRRMLAVPRWARRGQAALDAAWRWTRTRTHSAVRRTGRDDGTREGRQPSSGRIGR
jgi:hypothetical protein